MFKKLIAVITFLVQREQQLEGYSQIAIVWGAQAGRTDRRGKARKTEHQSPLRYILAIPEARAELETLYKSAHGAAANFPAAVQAFFTSTSEISKRIAEDATLSKVERKRLESELQRRQMLRSDAIEKFEAALLTLPVPAEAGWSFSIGQQSGRLLAGNPSQSRVLETDDFLAGLKDILSKS